MFLHAWLLSVFCRPLACCSVIPGEASSGRHTSLGLLRSQPSLLRRSCSLHTKSAPYKLAHATAPGCITELLSKLHVIHTYFSCHLLKAGREEREQSWPNPSAPSRVSNYKDSPLAQKEHQMPMKKTPRIHANSVSENSIPRDTTTVNPKKIS